MIEPGTLVDGKFRVERVLGKGGMGTVLAATHVQLNQRVAIKVLNDNMVGDPSVVERFLREARASAQLRSDHVCRVSDVGQDGAMPYMVMELLDGEDLSRSIAVSPLDEGMAADYVMQACVAIAEAHGLGIVHRDLKPSNLFLARRVGAPPMIKVLDFGIAKAPIVGDAQLTHTNALMGSPAYMSPEQLRSPKEVDLRSDIWSLGVILYELVSRRLPFVAETITELAVKATIEPPAPLVASPRYVAIVMRCLDKQPERRYPNIGALAQDLAACRRRSTPALAVPVVEAPLTPGLAPTVPPTVPPVAVTPELPRVVFRKTPASGVKVVPPPPKRRPIALIVGGAVGVIAIGLAIYAATRGSKHKPAKTAVVVPEAGVDATTYDPVQRCRNMAEQHDWAALESCATGINDADLALKARTERAAQVSFDKLRAHADLDHLEDAHFDLVNIPATSIYRDDADKTYANGRKRVLAKGDQLARAGKCDDLAALHADQPEDVAAALASKSCGKVGCEIATLDTHAKTADDLDRKMAFAGELVELEAIIACKSTDDLRKRAYAAACKSHNFARAKEHWNALKVSDRNVLASTCVAEGFDPRK